MPINEWGQEIGDTVNFKVPEFPSNVYLDGRYCKLVPLTEAHAEDLYKAHTSTPDYAKNWTYIPTHVPKDLEDYKKWLVSVISDKEFVQMAIIDKKTGKPVGSIAYLAIVPQSGAIEAGWVHFSPLLSQTPLSTEAQYLMMDHAFDMGYRRYAWRCDSLNAPSRKAALRMGFRFEAEFRNAMVYKGRTRNTCWFSITDDEYPAVKAAFEAWLDPSNFDINGQQLKRLEDFRH